MLDDCYERDGCASNSVPPRGNFMALRPRQAHQNVEHAHLNVGGEAQAPQQPNEGASSSRVNNGSQQPTHKEANTHTPTKRSERIAARHERTAHQGHHCGSCQTSEDPQHAGGTSKITPPLISGYLEDLPDNDQDNKD
uniref:Uncharacterized protein n=1 Tax=Meloidogyne incognita TaxID=6306 RepID=A0A914L046_MELIC